jgi:hypothetical protein
VGIAIGFESYRIGEGGPLRRFELRCSLTTPLQQIFAFLVVAWVPILVLGAWFQATTGWREPLLHDLATHVRLLVAAPLFLLLDHRFPSLCSGMLSLLARQSFVDEADRPRFERTLARARRHSDSWIPEAVLACLSLAMGVAALEDIVHVRALADRSGLPALRAWYAFVTLPLFQFLLWRSLWRWAIWASILFDLSFGSTWSRPIPTGEAASRSFACPRCVTAPCSCSRSRASRAWSGAGDSRSAPASTAFGHSCSSSASWRRSSPWVRLSCSRFSSTACVTTAPWRSRSSLRGAGVRSIDAG